MDTYGTWKTMYESHQQILKETKFFRDRGAETKMRIDPRRRLTNSTSCQS